MRRTLMVFSSLLVACSWPSLGRAQTPRFALEVQAPPELTGPPGGTVEITATARLTSDVPGAAEGEGVEGWSVGMSTDLGAIVSATTAGTAGAPEAEGGYRLADGYEIIRFTADGKGVTCAVVLSNGSTRKATLPPTGTESLLRIAVEADVPLPIVSGGQYLCDPSSVTVSLVNGLAPAGQQPVQNKVSVEGTAYRPTLGASTVQVCPDIAPPPEFRLSLVAPSAVTGEANRDVEFDATAQLTTSSNATGFGVEGWSIAIGGSYCSVVSATTDGTAAEQASELGFEKTEITVGADNEGVVSAVVLSLDASRPVQLPREGTADILRLRARARVPSPVVSGGAYQCAPLSCQLGYKNGLRGTGQPVQNKATIAGLAFRPVLTGSTTSVCPRIVTPRFTLSVEEPASVTGPIDGKVRFDATARVLTENNTGADGIQGWSIALAGTECRIVSATVEGTPGAPAPGGLRDGGFEKTELTVGAGNEGVVSAVALSFQNPAITLPPTGSSDLLVLRAEADVPDPVVSGGVPVCAPRSCRVFFKNGLEGSGEPVENKVTYRGLAYRPRLLAGITNVCADISVPSPTFALSIEVPETAEGDAGSEVLLDGVVRLATSANPTTEGVQGWSVGVSAGDCGIVDPTVLGTAGALRADGGLRRADGFEKTELTTGAGNQGAISAVVLSFGGEGGEPVTLPPNGAESILRFKVRATVPDPVNEGGRPVCAPLECLVDLVDGLKGTGQPVDNKVTYLAAAVRPTRLGGVSSICPTILEGGLQKPIDENQDGQLDISDPIAILNFLFTGINPSLPCGDGLGDDPANVQLLDANGDDQIDLSDPVWVLSFLFLGGPRPTNCRTDQCPCIRVVGCPDVEVGCGA